MLNTYKTNADYYQICIFDNSLENPFNDWNDNHVSQGFSWRESSVSFGTFNSEEHIINVFLNENNSIDINQDRYIRVVKVPIKIFGNTVVIGGLFENNSYNIEKGNYVLQIEFLEKEDQDISIVNIRLNKGITDFVILKADSEISVFDNFDIPSLPAIP